jgi:hypothetical protein
MAWRPGCCNKTLESVYKSWLDSVSFRGSFNGYLGRYKLSSDLDIWNVNIHHPFRQVDERWLAEIGKNISDKAHMSTTLAKLRRGIKAGRHTPLEFSFGVM